MLIYLKKKAFISSFVFNSKLFLNLMLNLSPLLTEVKFLLLNEFLSKNSETWGENVSQTPL